MSVSNQAGEEQQLECPLCMEALEVDDLHFYPCTCGYQICRFCWNRIREGENGLCPACRKAYPENPAEFIPLNQEQVAAIKTERKAKEQKRRNKTLESRKALANVRVVQKNLVFVVGLPVRLADPEILKRQEYFGKYGKIHKVVINQSTTYAGSQGPSASAYVTYVSAADALRAIQGVSNVTLDGRVLKSSLGTTKYCAHFMKNQPCPKTDCMYLHELGDPKASFTKEEMHAGLHQVYERKLHNQLLQSQREEKNCPSAQSNSSTNGEKTGSKEGTLSSFLSASGVTSNNISIGNSTKSSKKDGSNGSLSSAKEAWPSLGSTPPSESPVRTQSSPKPHTGKSQESSTSDSSTSTQAQTKSIKDNTERGKSKNKEHNTKKNKSEAKNKQKNAQGNTMNGNQTAIETNPILDAEPTNSSVFETAKPQSAFLTNELDELESDRHSLLENHDLLDGSDHSLLDEDTHNLLDDAEDVRLMNMERDPLLGFIDSSPLVTMKSNLQMNGYVMDRNPMSYMSDRELSQMNQSILEQKELQSRAEAMLRQSEVLSREHSMIVDGRYIVAPNLGMESHSDLLGANYQQNSAVHPYSILLDNQISAKPVPIKNLTPSALVANSVTSNHISINSLSTNQLSSTNPLQLNSLSTIPMSINSLSTNSMPINTLSLNPMPMSSMSHNPLSVSHIPVNSMSASAMSAMSMSANQMAASSLAGSLGVNSMGVNALNGGYMMHNQPMMRVGQQMQPPGLMNGYENSQSSSEGRYLAENMDKFFTDFKAQQLRLVGGSAGVPGVAGLSAVPGVAGLPGVPGGAPHPSRIHSLLPQNVLSAERLEMQHQHRMGSGLKASEDGGLAAGDCDDDLDFDPFKETQKALAELIETETMHTVSSGDGGERARRVLPPPPPGFSASYVPQPPRSPADALAHGFSTNNALYTDWTQMDPAIMSTSVTNKPHPQSQHPPLHQSQPQPFSHHELFARFNTLSLNQSNGVKIDMPMQWTSNNPKLWQGMHYQNIPLPPGFSPAKPTQRPTECIDAK